MSPVRERIGRRTRPRAADGGFRRTALLGLAALTAGAATLASRAPDTPFRPPANEEATGELRGRILMPGGGGLASAVVVYLSGESIDGLPASSSGEPRIMDQRDYAFVPRLLAVRAGEEIEFHNSDSIAHNVHTSSMGRRRNRDFNRNQRPGQVLRTAFPAPDSLRVVCDVHSQMLAYIFIVPSPFFTLVSGEGEYRISGIPQGRHELHAWHEDHGFVTQEVEILAGSTTVADLEFAR